MSKKKFITYISIESKVRTAALIKPAGKKNSKNNKKYVHNFALISSLKFQNLIPSENYLKERWEESKYRRAKGEEKP